MKYLRSKPIAFVLVALTFFGALGCGGDPGAPEDDDTAELQLALDGLAASELTDMGILGLGITVSLRDGRVLHSSAGYSDPIASTPYDVAGTRQVIGSVTKVYTAVMVMQLVESGLLSLDETIDRWFSIPRADEITVRMLLNHTSGLNEFQDGISEADFSTEWSPEELLQVAVDEGAWASPGENLARYANTNYVVLGLIVEAVTGRTWEQNLAERISEPLGLERTFDAGEPPSPDGLAGGWVHTEGGWINSLTMIHPSIGWANGSLVTTNEELSTFARAFFAGDLFDSPETLEQMLDFEVPMDLTREPGQPPATLGLCVMHYDAEGVALEGHVGHTAGYSSAMLREPETGALIVVTSNTDGAIPGWTALKIAQYLRAR